MKFTQSVTGIDRYEFRVKGPNIYGGDLDDAVQACRNRMEELGLRSDYSDSVNVKPEDDDIVVWFETARSVGLPTAVPVHPDNVTVLRADAWDRGYVAGQRDDQVGEATTSNPFRGA